MIQVDQLHHPDAQQAAAEPDRGPKAATVTATWNGVTLAESDRTVVVEGNHYFPPESVRWEHLRTTRMRSLCPWKGIARYYTATTKAGENRNAAWSYPHPYPWIRKIRGHVAFWNGVEVHLGAAGPGLPQVPWS